jgi:hypothetical protein
MTWLIEGGHPGTPGRPPTNQWDAVVLFNKDLASELAFRRKRAARAMMRRRSMIDRPTRASREICSLDNHREVRGDHFGIIARWTDTSIR